MRRIAILGSTGSIGTQALDIVRHHRDLFTAQVLTAGSNVDLLIRQAREFQPDAVVIADTSKYQTLQEALADLPIKVYAGADAIEQVAALPSVDMVLTAMVGFAGLRPTIAAIKEGKAIALANKETLVVAGRLIMQLSKQYGAPILPVDSEHSAIFQCLAGEEGNAIERILLTASGGPFRLWPIEKLKHVTAEEALKHPNWDMGAKITIDSASMLNKGFEMIEAYHLYHVPPERIQVVIHPESIIHSAVEFADGAVIAQAGTPDMRLPIQYAFSYPTRLPVIGNKPLDLFSIGTLHFEKPDYERFPCLRLSFEAINRGGNVPCMLNAAGEITNAAFRKGLIGFLDMPRLIEKALSIASFVPSPTLDDLFATDTEVRALTSSLIS